MHSLQGVMVHLQGVMVHLQVGMEHQQVDMGHILLATTHLLEEDMLRQAEPVMAVHQTLCHTEFM